MSDTPIYDSVAADMMPPAGEDVELENPEEDLSPGSFDPPADEDPDPVLNDDADDDLTDVEEGEDPGDVDDLDGPDDDDAPPATPPLVSEPATEGSEASRA